MGSSIAQIAEQINLKLPTILPPPPPPPPCPVFDIDVTAFTTRLEMGDIPADEDEGDALSARSAAALSPDAPDSLIPAPFRCEDGPKKVKKEK